MQRVCKCHGVSGSCSIRVCWRRLPALRMIGEALGQLYDGASHVKVMLCIPFVGLIYPLNGIEMQHTCAENDHTPLYPN